MLDLFQISCVLLLPSLEQRLHLFLYRNGILLTHLSQILLALHRSCLCHIREDAGFGEQAGVCHGWLR